MTAPCPAPLLVITDRRQARRPLPEVVAAAVTAGARWVLLRERDLPPAARARLAAELRELLAAAGGTLSVAGADPLGGAAVHLPAAAGPPPRLALVGRSCHDRTELARITTEDYATVSPVWATASKPGYGPPLHPGGLRALVRRSPVPVLALGGIGTAAQVRACRAAGATGVAVLGAVMRAPDPAAVVADLLAAAAAPQSQEELAAAAVPQPQEEPG